MTTTKAAAPTRRPTLWIPSWPGLRRNSSSSSENSKQSPPPPSKRPTNVRGRLSAVRNVSDDELFEGQCLKRQMYTPKVPYPAWDYNWDNRMTPETSLEAFRDGLQNVVSVDENKVINTEQNVIQQQQRTKNSSDNSDESNTEATTTTSSSDNKKKKRKAKTRHIILVRHGQYEETQNEDGRKLTPLGRFQARQTGKRLAQMAQGSRNFYQTEFNGPCRIKAIYVSDLIRAKETANLIAEQMMNHLPRNQPPVQSPDPMLNETLPAPVTPIRPDIPDATEEIDANQVRVEKAFHKYFYRDVDTMVDEDEDDDDDELDEFEIIVGHGNMIRFFFCRAMQLPPEAWLRFSTFNCSITYLVIRPDGMVSARAMGDVGHLTYDQTTFSGYHGYKW